MKTDIFDGSRHLYYRSDLEARFNYLVDAASAMKHTKTNIEVWLDAHCQELAYLQQLLYQVPHTDGCKTMIFSAEFVQKYCVSWLKNNIRMDNPFLSKYIDVDAIAEAIVKDMKRVDANGKVFYWIDFAN